MSRPLRWSELVEAVTDWQERTGIDPADMLMRVEDGDPWVRFTTDVTIIHGEGVILAVGVPRS